jgi:hypothetical protein
VTIAGVGFTSSSTVKVNGAAASAVTFVSATKLIATVPASATTGKVTVTNTAAPTGTVRSSTSYTVTPHTAPTVSSFTPPSGITGSSVTITGSYFSGATTVKFASLAAVFSIVSATQIKATVPDGATPGNVAVTTAAGTGTSTASFTPTLSVTSFAPTSAPPAAVVTITGRGFTSGSTVKFNTTPAAVTFVSATQLKATVPAGATTGRIHVTNTASPAGTVQSRTSFTVN